MSNLETRPSEIDCRGIPVLGPAAPDATVPDVGDTASSTADAPVLEVITARDVPLGGPRAMTVHRTLPQRRRSLVGAWCFIDHYGPDDVAQSGGMDVPPHPHIGLQTVSWLFAGEVEHRDTMGNHAFVRPGELNLMTAGRGIAHSEVSTPSTTVLHGVQLWVALPADAANGDRDFQRYVPQPVHADGATVSVFLGSLLGSTSPVTTHTPLVGAELTLAPGARIEIPVDRGFEHAVLVDSGRVQVVGQDLERTELGYVGVGADHLTIANVAGEAARLILVGGAPFGEDIIMWWNFVGRDHDEIARARDEWQRHSDRFGEVVDYRGAVTHLPAPALPTTPLRTRVNHPGNA